MEQTDIFLKIQNLNKSFPGVKALDNIDFELYKGEVHGLLGENGAGKSTLIKIISGVYKKDNGQIVLNNEKCDFHTPRDAFNRGISVIHQETSLIPQLTVLQNIFLGIEDTKTWLGLLDKRKIEKRYTAISASLGFHLPRDEQARRLSVAQQKMTEILKAMVHSAALIIMDEPTDALTENEIRQLFKIIQDLKKKRVTILYITHYLEEVFQICDRLTVLRDGKKIDTRKTGEVTQKEIVKMMIGQEHPADMGQALHLDRRIPALAVESLSSDSVVKEVSFTAYQGEILGITGVIGSGKTELGRMIFGADRPDQGAIQVAGHWTKIKSPVQAIAHGIGMLPEDRKNLGLLLEHEVYKNISLPSLARFCKGGIIIKNREFKAITEMIRRLDIKLTSSSQPAKYLSGGNQQKVVVGKWLVSNPKVLIMDEPTRGIDVGSKAEIHNIMRELANAGACIIFLSAEVPEIVTVCDRILLMRKGRIFAEYQRGVTQQEIIQKLLEGNHS
jgi:ribose transport system ATP-binding protein